jgi:hypothetical protein
MMEVYLLSLALSRHRMIVPQPQQRVQQAGVLDSQQHSYDAPALAPARIDDLSRIATLHRPAR